MHVCMLATAIIRDGTIYWYITVSWHTKSDTVSIQIQVTPIYQISWHIDVSVSIDSILHTLYTSKSAYSSYEYGILLHA